MLLPFWSLVVNLTQTGLVLGSIFCFFVFGFWGFPILSRELSYSFERTVVFYLEFPLVFVGAACSGPPTLERCWKWPPWLSGHRFFWGASLHLASLGVPSHVTPASSVSSRLHLLSLGSFNEPADSSQIGNQTGQPGSCLVRYFWAQLSYKSLASRCLGCPWGDTHA